MTVSSDYYERLVSVCCQNVVMCEFMKFYENVDHEINVSHITLLHRTIHGDQTPIIRGQVDTEDEDEDIDER